MPTYIITFDIDDSDRRSKFREAIKTYGGYCPIHKNAWAISSNKSAVEIRDYLSKFLVPDDRLFVIRSGTEAAWRHSYGNDHNEWLKKNL